MEDLEEVSHELVLLFYRIDHPALRVHGFSLIPVPQLVSVTTLIC